MSLDETKGYLVSFPADFSPSVGKSTSGKLPIAFRFAVFQSFMIIACVTYSLTSTAAMQSYVTLHVYANVISAHLNRNGDVLSPTEGRGEKSAGHETKGYLFSWPFSPADGW